MGYSYSGTECLSYGNWIRRVCNKWNCEFDRPSKETGVNLDKKQKCYLYLKIITQGTFQWNCCDGYCIQTGDAPRRPFNFASVVRDFVSWNSYYFALPPFNFALYNGMLLNYCMFSLLINMVAIKAWTIRSFIFGIDILLKTTDDLMIDICKRM